MANIFDSSLLQSDYDEFKKNLKTSNILKYDVLDSKYNSDLKKTHRCIYSLLIIHSKVSELHKKENKHIFLNEIISDSLVAINLFFIGFNHASQIIFRRIIENYYHHLYFFNHEVEFVLQENGKNDYVPILEFKKYIENHPTLTGDTNIKTFNDDIFNRYQELCKFVHTKGSSYMTLATNLEDLKSDFDLKLEIEIFKKIIQKILYITYKFHRDIKLTNEEKNIVFLSIDKDFRGKLSE